MAKTIVKFSGRSTIVDDADIFIVVGYLLSAHRESIAQLDEAIAQEWSSELEEAIPGAINLRLDQLLDTDAKTQGLARILLTGSAEITKIGEFIPADIVKSWAGNTDRFKFEDQETAVIVEAMDSLAKLIWNDQAVS